MSKFAKTIRIIIKIKILKNFKKEFYMVGIKLKSTLVDELNMQQKDF